MRNRPQATSGGCGIAGCFGGLTLTLLGGLSLLVICSFFSALTATISPPAPTAPDQADLRVTISETFLNQFIQQQPLEGTGLVDILPGNQIRVTVETTLLLFELPVPVQVDGLFELRKNNQSLEVALLNTQVIGVELPPELANVFDEDLALVNQDLSNAVKEISNALGVPVVITQIRTTDSEIQLDFREFPGGVN